MALAAFREKRGCHSQRVRDQGIGEVAAFPQAHIKGMLPEHWSKGVEMIGGVVEVVLLPGAGLAVARRRGR